MQSKLYVKIHVIKHDMDPNRNINCSRKIPQTSFVDGLLFFITFLQIFFRLRMMNVCWQLSAITKVGKIYKKSVN